ncbi:MAG: RNA polymerase sigma factor [Planctomycetota bacterium]
MPQEAEYRQDFEDCVHDCADSLYRVAFRLTGEASAAQDLVQETYLNAWKGIKTLESKARMRAWVFAILRNQYSKYLRQEKKISTHSSNVDSLMAQTTSTPQIPDEIQKAIDKLDDKHKLPLLLMTMEGLTADETATALDIPRGTVLSRVARAKDKLRRTLSTNPTI